MNELSIVEQFHNNFLHGELNIRILKAEDLCGVEDTLANEKNAQCIFLKRAFSCAKKMENPFVAIYLEDNCICQTSSYANRYDFSK